MQPNFTPATQEDIDAMEARQDSTPGVPDFRPFDSGDTVRNQYGETLTVWSVNMPMVYCSDRQSYHWTKLIA